MKNSRPMHFIDQCLIQFDQALRTIVPGASHAHRLSPANKVDDVDLNDRDRKHVAGLMRINHTGEVCAQALYQGQAATARLDEVREAMETAAGEEVDHLAWCEERLQELNARPSIFNPLWYTMSYGLGALAGIAGDKWSLGFVAETENQVCEHLEDHLNKLPEEDEKSKAILEQMLVDEKQHETTARDAGGTDLPNPLKQAMTAMSQVMKETTYRI